MLGRMKRNPHKTGQLVELAFVPNPMWPGFDFADHRIAAKADFPRLGNTIGQAWRLPEDTYDTETHFRFPDGTRLRKGAAPSGIGLTVFVPGVTVSGQTVTFAGGAGVAVSSTAVVGKKWVRARLDFAEPPPGSEVAFVFSDASGAQKCGLFINSTLGVIASGPTDYQDTGVAFNEGDAWSIWRDADTGEWGYVTPAGVVSDDLTATCGAVIGEAFLVVYPSSGDVVGSVTLLNEGGVGPGGYTRQIFGVAAAVGQRAGSTESAAHALTVEEMPAHDHDFSVAASFGDDNGPYVDGVNAFSLTPVEGVVESAGGGQAHSHAINPEHVISCVLVKL